MISRAKKVLRVILNLEYRFHITALERQQVIFEESSRLQKFYNTDGA